MKLNLGCGQKHLPGYVNCDMVATAAADEVFDLDSTPYPFAPESVDHILLDNVLEHLEDIVQVMVEVHRILKPGGTVTIVVPYAKSDSALQDPTHRHLFTERSMDYFVADHEFGDYYSSAHFELLRADLVGNTHTRRHRVRNLVPFKPVLRWFLYNVYDVVHFELRKPLPPPTSSPTDQQPEHATT